MKRQLTVVSGECNIVVVLCKMPHIIANGEYSNMLMFMASVVVVPLLLLKNTVGGFLCAEFRILGVFQSVQYIACMLSSAHASSERACQQHVEEQESILEIPHLYDLWNVNK